MQEKPISDLEPGSGLDSGLDPRPDWIKNNEVGKGRIEYEGRDYFYTILDSKVQPKLPGFLGYPDGENLFISEGVPEEFRDPQLIHEIIEYTELKGKEGRCLEALRRELEIAREKFEEEKYLEYLEYRRNFFAKLVDYYKESSDEGFKTEIRRSYEYLEKILEKK